jgi:hypothetical protein
MAHKPEIVGARPPIEVGEMHQPSASMACSRSDGMRPPDADDSNLDAPLGGDRLRKLIDARTKRAALRRPSDEASRVAVAQFR